MGAVVLVIAGFFLVFAYTGSQHGKVDGYPLIAKFDRIDGINVGSDVSLSGVKIGTVTDLTLDDLTYLATVTMSIDPKIKLPKDTSAEVVSSGLLAGKYIALVPGGDEKNLEPGQEILYTQAAVSLEAMIGQLIFNKKKDDSPNAQ